MIGTGGGDVARAWVRRGWSDETPPGLDNQIRHILQETHPCHDGRGGAARRNSGAHASQHQDVPAVR